MSWVPKVIGHPESRACAWAGLALPGAPGDTTVPGTNIIKLCLPYLPALIYWLYT